jgi:hypothetical protein
MSIEEVFAEIDTDNDSELSRAEVTVALQKLKLDISQEDLTEIIKDLGGGHEQKVKYETFAYRLHLYREQQRFIDLLEGRLVGIGGLSSLVSHFVLPKFTVGQVFDAAARDQKLQPHTICSLADMSEMQLRRRLVPFLNEVVSAVIDVAKTAAEYEQRHESAENLSGSDSENADMGKFAMPVRQAQFGHVDLFRKGLDSLIGLPAIDIFEAMHREHDENVEFTAHNYDTVTTPRQEWEFVICPDPDRTYPGEKLKGAVTGRERKHQDELMQAQQCVTSGLTWEEVVALRLYTGPMFQKYNCVLRESLRREVMLGAQKVVRRWQRSFERCRKTQVPIEHNLKSWINFSSWKRVNETSGCGVVLETDDDHVMLDDKDTVSLEELVEWATRLGLSRHGSAEEVAARLADEVEEWRKSPETKPRFASASRSLFSCNRCLLS